MALSLVGLMNVSTLPGAAYAWMPARRGAVAKNMRGHSASGRVVGGVDFTTRARRRKFAPGARGAAAFFGRRGRSSRFHEARRKSSIDEVGKSSCGPGAERATRKG